MKYATYDTSGKILCCGSAPLADTEMLTEAHPLILFLDDGVEFLDTTHYVDNGVLTSMGAQPSVNHTFNFATKTWEDPRSLNDLKLLKWTEIKSSRTAAIDAPLTTPYGPFDCTPSARTSITDAILLLQTMSSLGTAGQAVDFTLADNTTATFTLAQMINVGLLLGQKTQQIYAQGRVLRTALEVATTVAEIDAVVWL